MCLCRIRYLFAKLSATLAVQPPTDSSTATAQECLRELDQLLPFSMQTKAKAKVLLATSLGELSQRAAWQQDNRPANIVLWTGLDPESQEQRLKDSKRLYETAGKDFEYLLGQDALPILERMESGYAPVQDQHKMLTKYRDKAEAAEAVLESEGAGIPFEHKPQSYEPNLPRPGMPPTWEELFKRTKWWRLTPGVKSVWAMMSDRGLFIQKWHKSFHPQFSCADEVVQNESSPCSPDFETPATSWKCNGCVFHACVHVGISEWVLTLLLVGLGRDNSVFEAACSDSLCGSLHVDSISPLCSIDYSIDAAIFNTTVSNSWIELGTSLWSCADSVVDTNRGIVVPIYVCFSSCVCFGFSWMLMPFFATLSCKWTVLQNVCSRSVLKMDYSKCVATFNIRCLRQNMLSWALHSKTWWWIFWDKFEPHLPVNLWCRLPQSSTEFHLPCHAFWMVSHRSCTKCWPKVRPWFPAWMQVVAWCATDAVSWPMWPSGRINGVVPPAKHPWWIRHWWDGATHPLPKL